MSVATSTTAISATIECKSPSTVQVAQEVFSEERIRALALKILWPKYAKDQLWHVLLSAKKYMDDGLILNGKGVQLYDRKNDLMILSSNCKQDIVSKYHWKYFPNAPSEMISTIQSVIEENRKTFHSDIKDAPVFDEPAIKLALEGKDPDILACKKAYTIYSETIEKIIAEGVQRELERLRELEKQG
jgi:hypothetical protein